MALFTLTTNEYINQPPSQIGNGSAITNYGQVYTFTEADFTTNTVPVYIDPEGDNAFELKITSLPSDGTLEYNSVAVIVNQIISFSDIGSGLFKYIPDNGNTSQYNTTFNFEVSDSGSQIFIS